MNNTELARDSLQLSYIRSLVAKLSDMDENSVLRFVEVNQGSERCAMLQILAGWWMERQAQCKMARVRRHWEIARAFVHVYPYALLWQDHACRQLCAPGGKWASLDRAAFEEDFSGL